MQVYASTYHKYNSGNLAGDWLDITDYTDHEEFLAACRALHKDEPDPEFMYQDMEDDTGILRHFFDESGIDPELWEVLDYTDLTEQEEAVAAFLAIEGEWNRERFEDTYYGYFATPGEMAESCAETSMDLSNIPSWVVIDWEATARNIDIFVEHDGHYFWND